jgi:hypothetical protein
MIPVSFPGVNITIEYVDGQEYNAFKGIDASEHEFIMTAWQPSYEDIKAIIAGQPIYIKCKVKADVAMPDMVFTLDENNKGNI